MTTLTIGQEVVIASPGAWEMHYTFDYFVHKITPKGQVTVRKTDPSGAVFHEFRFNADGYEVGSSAARHGRGTTLCTNIAEIREALARKERAKIAASLLSELGKTECRGTYSKEYMLEAVAAIEAKLAKARAAVEAI